MAEDISGNSPMKIFDSHCHLDDRVFRGDLDAVLGRAAHEGVQGIMIAGVNARRSARAVEIASRHERVYAAVGVHPHNASECSEGEIESLVDLTRDENVRAWGEFGLDFNRMFSPRSVQEQSFLRQLEVADELRLPVILHERDSGGKLLELLEAHTSGERIGVVHCFGGNEPELRRYLDLGLHIGVTGIITIEGRGKSLRDLVPLIPIDRILVETDAPYLVPAQHKKTRRNEPAFVKSVLLKVAKVTQQDPEKLAKRIWRNTCMLFRIEQ